MPRYTLEIDGAPRAFDAQPDEPLLYVLTDKLKFKGPRFGCGLAQCGTCTVLLDGQAVRSCVVPASALQGRSIRTLDGLERDGRLHPVQQAFVDEQAAQCGYCANGWVMHTVALLERKPQASEAEIREGLAGVQCRCGTQIAILRAVRRARDQMAAQAAAPKA